MNLSEELINLAENNKLLYDVARKAIEDELIEYRDARISLVGRNNGLVVREKDGTESSVIRLGPEMAVATALRALAKHLEEKTNEY